MCSHQNTKQENGSALVASVIVLALLTALGFAALSVADLNIKIAANDRDHKASFFHADAGGNIGHVYLEDAIDSVNSTFYDSNATAWAKAFDATLFPLKLYTQGTMTTHVRAGDILTDVLEGEPLGMIDGYNDPAQSGAHGSTFTHFIIRSHRIGARSSTAEVDLGWRHIN